MTYADIPTERWNRVVTTRLTETDLNWICLAEHMLGKASTRRPLTDEDVTIIEQVRQELDDLFDIATTPPEERLELFSCTE